MIYLPVEITNNNCAYIYDKETIRVYDNRPTTTGNYTYTDYYIHFDYNIRTGISTFSQYSTFPTCLSTNQFTSNYMYRIDFINIVVIVFIFLIICFYFPLKIMSRLFGRWLKI